MPPVNHITPTAELDLSLEEQWAVHVALLEYVEVAQQESERTPSHIELGLLEKIEDGDSLFTAAELRRLREECNYYARSEHVSSRDRIPLHRVVQRIDRVLPAAGAQ
mgnify:CR=1 FL=1